MNKAPSAGPHLKPNESQVTIVRLRMTKRATNLETLFTKWSIAITGFVN